jgi:hypothetical protein
MKEKTLTLPQTAFLLNMKDGTLRQQLNRDKQLKKSARRFPGAHKIGRDWVIPAKEIKKFKTRDAAELYRRASEMKNIR